MFISTLILRHFDLPLPISIETDVSGFAVSKILLQSNPNTGHWHRVAFGSRKKPFSERKYWIRESETRTIVDSCKQWHYYVESLPHKIKIITDHANFQNFLLDKNLSRKEAR